MLEYEWGLGPNPPPLMISSDDPDPTQDPALTHPIVDHHYPTPHHHHHHHSSFPNNTAHFLSSIPTNTNTFSSSSPFAFTAAPHQHHAANSLYDPRAFGGGASMYQAPPGSPPNFSLDCFPGGVSGGGTGFVVVPKSEDAGRSSSSSMADFTARLGLNLGGRTYFSSAEDDFVSRLYRRSRPVDASSASAPRCQAEGCNADLSHAKHYHRRHKVCEFHSKAAAVIAAGLTQRFCQQCSRFHLLSEFDNGKRSCRKRLADHNRRRRKSHHQSSQENAIKSQQEGARNSSSENPARSPQDSATQSTSSVTVALSPPRMLLDCFRQSQPYQATSSSASSSSCSLFFSSG